jgi:hypothetical protein
MNKAESTAIEPMNKAAETELRRKNLTLALLTAKKTITEKMIQMN